MGKVSYVSRVFNIAANTFFLFLLKHFKTIECCENCKKRLILFKSKYPVAQSTQVVHSTQQVAESTKVAQSPGRARYLH